MTSPLLDRLVGEAWIAVTEGDRSAPALPPRRALDIVGAPGDLPSHFAVEEVGIACVATALLAASALHEAAGVPAGTVRLDRGHVAAALQSEAHFRRGGQTAGMGFASLSRFWRAKDGWVRTHANYPWHRAALLGALGASEDPEDVAAAMSRLTAREAENRVVGAGGIAAAVRSLAEWHDHPQGRAVAEEPLVGWRQADGAPPRIAAPGELPLTGVRVLDLTRVIAGPVCTRYLAALGAEVVRIDPPGRLDMALGVSADTLLGKRSALVDFGSLEGHATLHDLLGSADVLVHGYRPGALDRFGLDFRRLARRHPGLVVACLDAWGHRGPWAGRRGFDSIVQGPSGISLGESADGIAPGKLPCQLLDHGTGYLAAAAVLDGLRRQRRDGGTHLRQVSLARTAAWLTAAPPATSTPARSSPANLSRFVVELESAPGRISAVAPPGQLGDRPLEWPQRATAYGADAPVWSA